MADPTCSLVKSLTGWNSTFRPSGTHFQSWPNARSVVVKKLFPDRGNEVMFKIMVYNVVRKLDPIVKHKIALPGSIPTFFINLCDSSD